MQVILQKNSITELEHTYIADRLNEHFAITLNDKSKIIFGYNGIGKSSLFKCIKRYSENTNIEYVDYSEGVEDIIRGGNPVIISVNINRIERLNEEVEQLKSQVNIKKMISDNFGITSVPKAEIFGQRIVNARKSNVCSFTKTAEDIERINTYIENVPAKLIVNNLQLLRQVISVQTEIDKDKSSAVFKLLNIALGCIDEATNICPVCDSEVNNLRDALMIKMQRLDGIKSEILHLFNEEGIILNEEKISRLVLAARDFEDSDLLQDFILCCGDVNIRNRIGGVLNRLEEISEELSILQTEANHIYRNLKNVETRIKSDFKKYYDVDERNVTFDDTNYQVQVKFPRDISKYSTGEINLMVFLFKIYSFLGSDKDIMVLDDPVSSLDLINHYKIAYELVKTSESKKLIILTHSIELLNVVHSQHACLFEYQYIEEDDTELIIQDVLTSRNMTNIITLENLLEADNGDFVEMLILKEQSPKASDIHKLFHYSPEPFVFEDATFSNHDLVRNIEEYQLIIPHDFVHGSLAKVKTLSSLRVWLEKKLYDCIPQQNTQLRDNFLESYTLGEKIDLILPRNRPRMSSLPDSLTREFLMSNKVMLNQASHYQSQVMPFAYAINLSAKDIND